MKNIKKEVQKTLDSYFKYVNLSFANLEIQDNLIECISNSENSIKSINDEIVFRTNKILDFSYYNFGYDFKIVSIAELDNSIIVDVIQDMRIRFNCSKTTKTLVLNEKRKVELIYDNGLKVIRDSKYQENDYSLDNLNETRIILPHKLRNLKACCKSEVDKGKNNARSNATYYYDREKAKKYALKYAYNPNKDYFNYETYGGDCTNFASQCLHSGGIPFDRVGNYKWYWNSKEDRSASWVSAYAFREYLLNNAKDRDKFGVNAMECAFGDVTLGDIVQFANPTHSMVVTGCLFEENKNIDIWKDKYEILITQHSGDESGRLVNFPLSLKPSTKGRFYIKIL